MQTFGELGEKACQILGFTSMSLGITETDTVLVMLA